MNAGRGSGDDFGDLIVLVLVVPMAMALVLGFMANLSHRVMDALVGWRVLVTDPMVAIPGTGVGLDAARLVVLAGVSIAFAVAARGSRRRRSEQ
ncbi:MAG: hypothetical protein Q4D96_10135 [Propionibacteriaceae bacterium]|nr:hypothetical protein [Propionibacteriaceae bacterium]